MIDLLVAQLAESEAALEGSQAAVADRDETIRELRDEIAEAWSEICSNPDLKQGDPGELSIGVREACDAAYKQGEEETGASEAADALRAYLVARGLPAAPVKLDDPHLDTLARLLL
jgi:hypothetical protein